MPPNAKGGKGYKKGKHTAAGEAKMLEWDPADGQQLGRVLRKLGDRRFQVYCNDHKKRICKLAGTMRKSEWVDEGTVVLIGVRELQNKATGGGEEVGDILQLVDTRIYGKLKKLPNVNPLLFLDIERQDEKDVRAKAQALKDGQKIEDDIFASDDEEEEDEGEEDEDSDDGLTGEEKQKKKQAARELREKKRDQKIQKGRSEKANKAGDGTEEINIDDI